MDSSRVALVRRLFEHMEKDDLAGALDELLEHSAEDVVFEPYVAQGQEIRGREALREFWSKFADEGFQIRAGAYSISEEGTSVIASGWLRTIGEGRLADTQSRWVYRFNDRDQIVSAGVERA